jgi:hypothetical protein
VNRGDAPDHDPVLLVGDLVDSFKGKLVNLQLSSPKIDNPLPEQVRKIHITDY